MKVENSQRIWGENVLGNILKVKKLIYESTQIITKAASCVYSYVEHNGELSNYLDSLCPLVEFFWWVYRVSTV